MVKSWIHRGWRSKRSSSWRSYQSQNKLNQKGWVFFDLFPNQVDVINLVLFSHSQWLIGQNGLNLCFKTFSQLPLHPSAQTSDWPTRLSNADSILRRRYLPNTLAGQDAIGQAQTGTGKTAVFWLCIINELLNNPINPETDGDRFWNETRALVLAPTRELAQQIYQELPWTY